MFVELSLTADIDGVAGLIHKLLPLSNKANVLNLMPLYYLLAPDSGAPVNCNRNEIPAVDISAMSSATRTNAHGLAAVCENLTCYEFITQQVKGVCCCLVS